MPANRARNHFLSASKPKTADMAAVSQAFFRAAPVFFILVSVTLMIFHKADAVPVEKMRTAMMDAAAPMLTAASAPFAYTVEKVSGLTGLGTLRAENLRLQAENETLRQWYEQALKLQAENQSFRQLLNVKIDSSMKYVTARIISDSGTSFVRSVLLPVGSADGVAKGNAVVSGHSLVGRIIESGRHASRALLITDLNSRIPVTIQNTRTKAILAGKNKELLKLERLPADSGVTVGSRIVTSGDGGQIPPEVPVGTIVRVGADGVWVKPLSDISKLMYVQVIDVNIDNSLITGTIE